MATLVEGRFARVAGRKDVLAALSRTDRKIIKVVVSDKVGPPFTEELATAATPRGIPVEVVPDDQMGSVAGRIMHQGVVAFFEMPPALDLGEMMTESKARSRQPLLLVLDDMADHPDLDELLRMSILAGAQGIIRKRGTGKALPTDCEKHLLLCEVPELAPALDELRTRHKLWVLGCSKEAPDSIFEMELDWALALVFGGPGQTLRKELADRCDALIKFPLAVPEAPVSEAHRYAVPLFDLMRQRLAWASRGKIRDVLWESDAKKKVKAPA